MSRAIVGEFCRMSYSEKISKDGNRAKSGLNSKVLNMNAKKSATDYSREEKYSGMKIKPVAFLAVSIIFLGFCYLYQVNDLATKGFEIRSLEKRIGELQKEAKKMQIREVELRSMYNIEKSTEELDLVGSQNITYVEMDGPFAMK